EQVHRAGRELAVGLQRGGHEPEDRREHDREHQPGEDIEPSIDRPRAHTTSRSRLKMRYQTKTQIPMIRISSVDAAAPKPNRLCENDCRMISVIIRSASGPGLLPSRIVGIANW